MTIVAVILVAGVCFLAYSNGSNDNFKGVATLFGSGTTNYKRALLWATVTTFGGSVCSLFLAETLVQNFSGKGLVPDSVAASPEFLQAVVLGAGSCVMLASRLGFPISTTHGLTGALVGAGFMAVGTSVNVDKLAGAFFLPLLMSPLIAVVLAGVLYFIFNRSRRLLGINKQSCVCIGEKITPVPSGPSPVALASTATLRVEVGETVDCSDRYVGAVLGLSAHRSLDVAHYLSSGVVSFARGLNDTPKVVAALVGFQAIGIEMGLSLVAIAMAVGGLVHARKVAETVSKKITPMNHGQGFTANVVTGCLVVGASNMGIPVSTTHVSVGSLFGIGSVTGKADKRKVAEIVAAWVLTLPIAAALAALSFWVLRWVQG